MGVRGPGHRGGRWGLGVQGAGRRGGGDTILHYFQTDNVFSAKAGPHFNLGGGGGRRGVLIFLRNLNEGSIGDIAFLIILLGC